MKKALLLTTFAAAFALTGCANQPTNVKTATVTPASNIYAFQAPAADTVPLTLIRDSGFVGGKCDVIASVNGRKAALIGNGEKAQLHVPAGDARISAYQDCPLGGSSAITTVNIEMVKGIETFVRVDTSDLNTNAVRLTETTVDNPSFVCKTPEPKIRKAEYSKAEFIELMRFYGSYAAESRRIARKVSVTYKDEALNDCLVKEEQAIKGFTAPIFQKMKDKAASPDEKAALIDAYSKFLTVINANMSINEISTLQAPFAAAVNKYELY